MSNVIIYKNADNSVSVIHPTEEALSAHTIQEIAEKDVPSGLAFKIVPTSDLPSDRAFRNAWAVDEATLTDGTGSQHDIFITDPAHPDYVSSEGG